MQSVEGRKDAERDLHDRLRGELADDQTYTANLRFYCVAHQNVDWVRRWMAARCKGRKALDYCCGEGGTATWLAQHGAETCGIDISPLSIEHCRDRVRAAGVADRATFAVMDAEKMEFPDGYFDLVAVNGVLHHLDLPVAYRELARVLASDGAVICTEALRYNPLIRLYRRVTPQMRSEWEAEHILGKPEIEAAREHFNRVEVVRFFHLATLLAVPLRNTPIFKGLLRVLQAIDSVLLRLPVLKWQAWMAVFILAEPKKQAGAGDRSGR